MSRLTDKIIENFQSDEQQSLKAAAYQALSATIQSRTIFPGEKINIYGIAQNLDISRSPIRYALKKLEKEGVVIDVSGSGYIVGGVDAADITEIFEIRQSLEPLAFKSAMKKMSVADFNELFDIINAAYDCCAEGDELKFEICLKQFNQYILDKSEMNLLRYVKSSLEYYYCGFRENGCQSAARRNQILNEHLEIFKCMQSNDSDRLDVCIKEHLNRSYTLQSRVM